MELLASGEPEEIEHLSDEDLDDRPRAPRRPLAQQLRSIAPLVAVLIVGTVLGGVGMSGWRDREQQVQAASTASLGLTFEQAVPAQQDPNEVASEPEVGVVRVYLVVENRSPGPVRVESARALPGRGLIRADVRAWRPRDLAPAETARVRVDVSPSPECDAVTETALPALRLSVTPGRGGMRDVQVQAATSQPSYSELMAGMCQSLYPVGPDAGIGIHVGQVLIDPGPGRTATLELRVEVGSYHGGPLPSGGSVTAAALRLPGFRVVQPTMPVPMTGPDSGTSEPLTFSLTLQSCAEARGGPPQLTVKATAGPHEGELGENYHTESLELELLRYLLRVC